MSAPAAGLLPRTRRAPPRGPGRVADRARARAHAAPSPAGARLSGSRGHAARDPPGPARTASCARPARAARSRDLRDSP